MTASGVGANGEVRDIAVEGDGGVLIAGDFTTYDGVSNLGLARLTATGARNTSNVLSQPFNAGFGVSIYSLIAEDDGGITVGGTFYVNTSASQGFRSGLARLNADGSRDTSFEPGYGVHLNGNTSQLRTVYDVEKQYDGKYIVVGSFTSYDQNATNYCARINSDGSFDSSFSAPSFNNFVRVALYQASSKVIVGGQFTSPSTRLERLSSNGGVDSSFQQGSAFDGVSDSFVSAVVRGVGAELWVGGSFYTYDGSDANPIVKISGVESPYEIWVQTQFTNVEITAGKAAEDADPDGDGIVNLAEMAFGTNPNLANTEPAFGGASNQGIELISDSGEQYLQISLDKSVLGNGAWFTAQFSDDLSAWVPSSPTPAINTTYDVIENSETKYIVRDKIPVSSASMRFGRFSIQLPE